MTALEGTRIVQTLLEVIIVDARQAMKVMVAFAKVQQGITFLLILSHMT